MAAPRFSWTGFLKLSLVTCPVAMMPAVSEGEKVRFHTVNRKTGNRVRSRYVDAESGEPIDDDDQVKGYEIGSGEYVTLEDEELESVALDSTRTINIEKFVPRSSIEWIWYDSPYYVVPSEEVGAEAFAVIRDAMEATETAGIARLVLGNREHAVMLKPRPPGMELWTLRFGDEVRPEKDYFGNIGSEKADAKSMKLVAELIDERSKSWSETMVKDPVQQKLKSIIAHKTKGKRAPPPKSAVETPTPPSNVVDMMAALKRSLASEKQKGRRRAS